MEKSVAGLDVAVLAGGLGTRLRSVLGDETPKLLAPIGGRPFLDVMSDWLSGYGAKRVVLCLGHLADRIQAHVAQLTGMEFICVVEPSPLGTGGALRFAAQHFQTDPTMIMNGDSWVNADLGQFVAEHKARDSYLSILCVPVDDASRYGRLEVAADQHVIQFLEKTPDVTAGIINAGIYLLSRQAMDDLCASDCVSFERDFLQKLPSGKVYAHVCGDARFIDFGTPESFAAVESVIFNVEG